MTLTKARLVVASSKPNGPVIACHNYFSIYALEESEWTKAVQLRAAKGIAWYAEHGQTTKALEQLLTLDISRKATKQMRDERESVLELEQAKWPWNYAPSFKSPKTVFTLALIGVPIFLNGELILHKKFALLLEKLQTWSLEEALVTKNLSDLFKWEGIEKTFQAIARLDI